MSSVQNISLYIPHIFGNYTKEYISRIFDELNIGKVNYIDFVSKMSKNGSVYNSAYIHFDEWYTNVVARNFQSRVLDTKKEARLMYEDPWYWIVLENKAKRVVPGSRKPRIVFDQSHPNISTPTRDTAITVPNAPKKRKFVGEIEDLEAGFEDMCRDIAIDFNNDLYIDDIESCMQEEDKHMISIDGRYVQTLEKENREYQDTIGEMEHKIKILIDENMCLKGEIEIIKQQFYGPPL